jgi:hypothetical protein
MQALTLDHRGSVRLLVHEPVVWGVAALVGMAMGMFAGALGALAALGSFIGGACTALRSRRVCRWIERSSRRASQRARREDREARLQEAGVGITGLVAATVLVDELTAMEPVLVKHLALEALLDRYVVLELAAARCTGILTERYGAFPVPEGSTIRTRIQVRSATLREACELRLAALQDEQAGIIEFFQLLLQRSVLEVTKLEGDPIGERIALLEDAPAHACHGMPDERAETAWGAAPAFPS